VIHRNAVRCKLCGDEIESTHRHDFRWCSCGAVGVDGGRDYLRRAWNAPGKAPEDVFEDLSVVEPEPDEAPV
jgi:DNA-directed RNA polymerase subunit N (RpoN/RPB10)